MAPIDRYIPNPLSIPHLDWTKKVPLTKIVKISGKGRKTEEIELTFQVDLAKKKALDKCTFVIHEKKDKWGEYIFVTHDPEGKKLGGSKDGMSIGRFLGKKNCGGRLNGDWLDITHANFSSRRNEKKYKTLNENIRASNLSQGFKLI